MDSIDYKNLYNLQDEVFAVVFKTENIFYLTGGTCLSRFYKAKRYSDDLDFFADNSPRYSFAIRKIKFALQEHFNLKAEVESTVGVKVALGLVPLKVKVVAPVEVVLVYH